MTTPLSPAARAVLDAFENASDGGYVEGVWVVNERTMLSAALRAAADQVVPEPNDWDKDNISEQGLWLLRLKRDQLLAIAAELEAQ